MTIPGPVDAVRGISRSTIRVPGNPWPLDSGVLSRGRRSSGILKGLIEHLRQTVRDGEALVVTREGIVESVVRSSESGGRISGRAAGFIHNQPGQQGHQVAADLVVLLASILNPPMGAAASGERRYGRRRMTPTRRWLEHAAVEGRAGGGRRVSCRPLVSRGVGSGKRRPGGSGRCSVH